MDSTTKLSEPHAHHIATAHHPALNVYKKTHPATATVLANEVIAQQARTHGRFSYIEETHHIVLDLSEAPEFTYVPGLNVGIVPWNTEINDHDPKHLRLYSIASAPQSSDWSSGRTLTLCVVRVIGPNTNDATSLFHGLCSNYLCNLNLGDKVQITGPSGTHHFCLPEKPADHNYIMIANGTGIAPIRSMLQELASTGAIHGSNAVWVFFGFRFSCHFQKYQAEFKALAAEFPNVFYRPAVSDEQWTGEPFFVQHAMAAEEQFFKQLLPLGNTRLYVCGGRAMKQGVDEKLGQWCTDLQMNHDQFFAKDSSQYFSEVY